MSLTVFSVAVLFTSLGAVPGIVVILVAAAYFGVPKDLIALVRAIGDTWRNK